VTERAVSTIFQQTESAAGTGKFDRKNRFADQTFSKGCTYWIIAFTEIDYKENLGSARKYKAQNPCGKKMLKYPAPYGIL
jgi:hypothetical protein